MTAVTRSDAQPRRPDITRWVAGLAAVAFGLATLAEGGGVLLGGPEAKAAAGAVVPFVLLFNFTAGFFYVAAGAGTLARQAWAIWLSRLLAGLTLLVFVAFGLHVLQGGSFEMRTVVAMTLRTLFWTAQAFVVPALLRPGRPS